MIAWKYINKNSAVVAAIRDYENMRFIIGNTPDEIKTMYEKMSAPHSANLTGLPVAKNTQAGTDKLAEQIDKLDLIRDRYRIAVEYMAWFEPAWSNLTEMERSVLSEFYMGDNQKTGATYRLMSQYNYSERKIEQLRSNALKRLSKLLYG